MLQAPGLSLDRLRMLEGVCEAVVSAAVDRVFAPPPTIEDMVCNI